MSELSLSPVGGNRIDCNVASGVSVSQKPVDTYAAKVTLPEDAYAWEMPPRIERMFDYVGADKNPYIGYQMVMIEEFHAYSGGFGKMLYSGADKKLGFGAQLFQNVNLLYNNKRQSFGAGFIMWFMWP